MKKKTLLITGAIIVIALYFLFQRPDYPDINTPKPIFGNPGAKIRIEEFADFECPACGSAHPTIKRVLEEFRENISYEFNHFPLSIHPNAQKAAQAAECANDQGRFYEYADTLFANQDKLGTSSLKQYAKDLGLDAKSFNACLDSGAKQKVVQGDQRKGLARGVDSTPTIFINGKSIQSWQYDSFKADVLKAMS